MKSCNNNTRRLVVIFSAIIFIYCFMAFRTSIPQTKVNQEDVKQAIQSDQWIFVAQSANPQGGRTQFLTSRYEFRKSKDTIISYLPYYGRSFSGAGAMTNANPLDFKSTNFTLEKKEKKKGGWQVTIKFKDVNTIRSMIFELYENGSANANVTLTDRTPITFLGSVEPLK